MKNIQELISWAEVKRKSISAMVKVFPKGKARFICQGRLAEMDFFIRELNLLLNDDTEASTEATVSSEVLYLLCSAIWYKDLPTMRSLPKNCNKGIVLCGWRHGNIIAQMQATMGLRTVVGSVGEYEQGFLTNDNQFVGRTEAAKIAFKSGQIKVEKRYLFSEDVW